VLAGHFTRPRFGHVLGEAIVSKEFANVGSKTDAPAGKKPAAKKVAAKKSPAKSMKKKAPMKATKKAPAKKGSALHAGPPGL